MGLREQYSAARRKLDAGYAMAGLLIAIAIMSGVMSMVMPAWHTWAKREKEAELIFRGEQYMRAIELYQRRFAGAYPADLETLVDQRFLRQAYADPVTGDEFEILTQASVRAAPGQAPPVPGMPAGNDRQPQFGSVTRADPGTASSPAPFSEAAAGLSGGGGGIIGVVSRSTDTAMALYMGRNRYDEWLFVYLPQAAQPGVGTGVPGQGGSLLPGLGGAVGGFGDITGQPGDGARGREGRGGRGGRQPGDGSQRPGVGAPRAASPGVGSQPTGGRSGTPGTPRRP